jgi:hypothetical protein
MSGRQRYWMDEAVCVQTISVSLSVQKCNSMCSAVSIQTKNLLTPPEKAILELQENKLA